MKSNSTIIADSLAAEKRRAAFAVLGTYKEKPDCRPLINLPALARFFRLPEYAVRTAYARGELPADFSSAGPLWDPIYLKKTMEFFIAAALRRDDVKTADLLAEAFAKIPPAQDSDAGPHIDYNNQFWLKD